jgi:predicted Fe-Mo cluster-binding NifX family protein
MIVGVTSQNFRTITGHAGKARRFLLFSDDGQGNPQEIERLDLPKEMSMHEFRGEDHPLYNLNVLITASCGQGLSRRMAEQDVRVITTSESDPQQAARAVLAGEELPPAGPHEHSHGVVNLMG